MEAIGRKPFEGVINIVRFNRHFYLLAAGTVILLMLIRFLVSGILAGFFLIVVILVALAILLSLAVSFYVYDRSGLYRLDWLDSLQIKSGSQLVNIHAGFDETSFLLHEKLPGSHLQVLDFYDSSKHTEASIARARKLSSVYPGTTTISTSNLPLKPNSVDYAFAILSAHEIRDRKERILFFKQLRNCLQQSGRIVVVEHLRDLPNFIAYNFGFFHFHSKMEWQLTFDAAGMMMMSQTKITPFIHVFILAKNGDPS